MREWGLPTQPWRYETQFIDVHCASSHENSIHSLAPCHACSVMPRHALPLIAGLGTLFNLRRGALSNCLLQLLHQSRFSWTEPCQFLNAEGMALEVGHLQYWPQKTPGDDWIKHTPTTAGGNETNWALDQISGRQTNPLSQGSFSKAAFSSAHDLSSSTSTATSHPHEKLTVPGHLDEAYLISSMKLKLKLHSSILFTSFTSFTSFHFVHFCYCSLQRAKTMEFVSKPSDLAACCSSKDCCLLFEAFSSTRSPWHSLSVGKDFWRWSILGHGCHLGYFKLWLVALGISRDVLLPVISTHSHTH